MTCAAKCDFIASYETSYIRFFDYLQALRSLNNICRAAFIKSASVLHWNTDYFDRSILDEDGISERHFFIAKLRSKFVAFIGQ